MTKEELEKEAEEYASMYARQYLHNDGSGLTNSYCEVYNAYYQSAEPREKRIAELEAQIKKMQDDIDCLTFACENYREEMEKNLADATELEKENAELKAQLESERDLPAIAYMQGAEKQKKKDEEELKKWKDEWQEQVQKATDEGYARTLQTMQLTKAKEILKAVVDFYPTMTATILLEAEQFLKDSEVEK